jgi:hypothetical protein
VYLYNISLLQVQDEQAKIEIAYVNVANQFLVHQLERLREVVSVEKGVVKSESVKMAIMNEMILLENNKCEDELLQLLVRSEVVAQQWSTVLAVASHYNVTYHEYYVVINFLSLFYTAQQARKGISRF